MKPCVWLCMENRVFRKIIYFDRKIAPLTRKIFSASVLPSNHFRRHAKRERERERKDSQTHKQREKERDRAVKFEIALVRSPSSSPPRDGEIAPRTHKSIDPLRPLTSSRHEPMNQSTHPSSSPMNPRTDHAMIGFVILIFFVLIFVSCVVYMLQLSVIIFVWILRKCEKHDKNGFSRAFSAKQPNTRKYFPKCF